MELTPPQVKLREPGFHFRGNTGISLKRVLFLTINPNLGSTARILQNWLLQGRNDGLQGIVAVQREGFLTAWLKEQAIPCQVNPMPLPNRCWPFSSLWQARCLAQWIIQHNIDIIHCNEHNIYPFAVLLRRLTNRPLVCHVRYKLKRGFCEWAFGGIRQPDALLWTTKQQRDDSEAAVKGLVPEDRQHLVSLGVCLDTFGTQAPARERTRETWGVRPDEIVFGTASGLSPRKRIEEFIALIEWLSRKDERVVGIIAGDARAGYEGYREQVLRRIDSAGLGRRLRWLGRLEPVEPFYHACDVYVSTSEYETFGNSVCEAMACRRPVVAYRGGSVHEVVQEAGCIVETGDFNALADASLELLQDPDRRAKLGTLGQERVARYFNPARSFVQLIDIYDTILAARRRER